MSTGEHTRGNVVIICFLSFQKESELSELRRTHWSLQRAIRGLSSHSTNEAQTQTSMTAKDENISYSYPMRHRAKQDPKTPDYGIDNPTYM